MDTDSIWGAVLSELELDVSKIYFSLWLKPTQLVEFKPVDEVRQIATIACRKPHQQVMVEQRYYGQIKTALDRITEKQNELVFTINPERWGNEEPLGPLFNENDDVQVKQTSYQDAIARVRLRQDYTFDTFAVSSTNDMAHAAASAVGRSPGSAYHLLFLYGGVGVGKTHLMTAVGHEILRQNPDTEMRFCSGEEFMNDLVAAIQTKQTGAFKDKYRKVKVLLVDDIQFIAGKDAVQEEFFHTFNAIVQNQGQIVLTSDKLPEEMVLLEDRLRSRFEGGLTIDIQAPNLELRTAILQIKAKARGIDLTTEVAHVVAARVESTRKLEGFLVKLLTHHQARNVPVTVELAQELLGPDGEDKPRRYVPPNEVVEMVASHFGLKANFLRGKKRNKELADARHLAMFLLRVDLEVPLQEVGRIMGGRDHTTVMHAVEKVKKLTETSQRWQKDLEGVRKKVFGGLVG